MINITTKKISTIMLTIAIILSLITIILSLVLNEGSKSEKVIGITQSSIKIEYILKDYNGHLAVFHSTESTPYEEFDIPTDSFGEYDKNLLLQGIHADSAEKIRKLIEDYTS